jgi:hypothetical protein
MPVINHVYSDESVDAHRVELPQKGNPLYPRRYPLYPTRYV